MSTTLVSIPPEIRSLLSRHGLLRSLVRRQVVADLVGTQTLDPESKKQAWSRFLQQNRLTDEQAVRRYQSQQGLSAQDLAWQIELPLRVRDHCRAHYLHKAEARFLRRKNQLDRVVYSLLRVKDGLLARELYLRIAAGEASFADLAAEYAEGPEKTTHGVVGPTPLTQAHPILAEKLRISAPGTLIEPFPVESWWLVVRLERFQPATFDEATALQMATELFEEWLAEETGRQLQNLTSDGASTVPA